MPVTLAYWAAVLIYEEMSGELPDFFREVWYAVRTGKFK